MAEQVWTFRFAQAFPAPEWLRASKTGTLSPWRGEFGIVTRRDGARFALAVAVRQQQVSAAADAVDAAVADVARAAVERAANVSYTTR
jgi:beta-lactamase class A